MYAPIILFAFNRLEPLKACIGSLLQNTEAAESNLIVYVDGARVSRQGEAEKVDAVKQFVKSIVGFKSVETHFSEENKGLGTSIIAGVTDVINRYGSAIVVEDDLILGKNYLAFMNKCLDIYKTNSCIFSVCGYSVELKIPQNYPYDIYVGPRSTSWGWATWKDRWDKCDWELENWAEVEKNAKAFNRWGGSDCYTMLRNWKNGINKSWAIRFCYNQFLYKADAVFPIISHVKNVGFDGNGTNCKRFNRYKYGFDESRNKEFKIPIQCVKNRSLIRQKLKYNSLARRAYSCIMNILYEKCGWLGK